MCTSKEMRPWAAAVSIPEDEPIYTDFFRAATGKAFTIVRAGLAFTITVFPKTSLLPAFVSERGDGRCVRNLGTYP